MDARKMKDRCLTILISVRSLYAADYRALAPCTYLPMHPAVIQKVPFIPLSLLRLYSTNSQSPLAALMSANHQLHSVIESQYAASLLSSQFHATSQPAKFRNSKPGVAPFQENALLQPPDTHHFSTNNETDFLHRVIRRIFRLQCLNRSRSLFREPRRLGLSES